MKSLHALTPTPPLGWNSYDCYGCAAPAHLLLANLEVMAQRLQPHGYQYFVVDNGWFAEYDIAPGHQFPTVKHADQVKVDDYGRYVPSDVLFPDGIQPLIDHTHELGLKFGIHIMRGVPRKSVELKLPILGTAYTAADIANVNDTCDWCHYNYGVDMDKPGAQPFYDSWIGLLAEWGVDFIKADDITGFPREIEAIVKAIERSGRDMVLSLSPGGQTVRERMDVYQQTNMLRTTTDIWDNRVDLGKAFDKWHEFNDVRLDGFWLDMDMIPFGHLMVWRPRDADAPPDDGNQLLSGKGYERMSGLSGPQQLTFITMRALAASPLFMGGDLLTSDESAFELITNADMLACNQNGVMGRRQYRNDGIEVWLAPDKTAPDAGWIGVFNRSEEARTAVLEKRQLGLHPDAEYVLRSIWDAAAVVDAPSFQMELAADGVVFLRFEPGPSA